MKMPRKAVSVFCVTFFGAVAFAQGNGYIKTHIDPGRAGVFVDGKYVGPAANFKVARKYSVAAGDHDPLARRDVRRQRVHEARLSRAASAPVRAVIVTGQKAVAEKSNGIVAIPALLRRLDLQATRVTIDAISPDRPPSAW